MGEQVLKWDNLRYFFMGDGSAAREIGGEINSFTVSRSGQAVTFPNYASNAIGREGGMVDSSINYQGYTAAGDDFELAGKHVLVMAPRGKSQVGDVVIFGDVVGGQYDHGANVGDAQTFTFDGPVNGALSRGPVLRNAYRDLDDLDASDAGPVTGDGVQLSTVGPGQALYAVVFLVAFTGDDITFSIETDAAGFAAPVERIDLGTFNAPGAALGSFDTEITPDNHARVVTSGTFTSATFVVAAAVGRI